MAKFTIWKSEIDLDDWKGYIADEIIPEIQEANNEIGTLKMNDAVIDKYMKEHGSYILDRIYDLNSQYYDDEVMNLRSASTKGEIVMLSTANGWNGSTTNLHSTHGHNIAEVCLHSQIRDGADSTYYVEEVNGVLEMKSEDAHHDGTNYYTYRELKPELTDEQIEEFREKAYEELSGGELSQETLDRYTNPIGHYVQEVYGFQLEGIQDRSIEGVMEKISALEMGRGFFIKPFGDFGVELEIDRRNKNGEFISFGDSIVDIRHDKDAESVISIRIYNPRDSVSLGIVDNLSSEEDVKKALEGIANASIVIKNPLIKNPADEKYDTLQNIIAFEEINMAICTSYEGSIERVHRFGEFTEVSAEVETSEEKGCANISAIWNGEVIVSRQDVPFRDVGSVLLSMMSELEVYNTALENGTQPLNIIKLTEPEASLNDQIEFSAEMYDSAYSSLLEQAHLSALDNAQNELNAYFSISSFDGVETDENGRASNVSVLMTVKGDDGSFISATLPPISENDAKSIYIAAEEYARREGTTLKDLYVDVMTGGDYNTVEKLAASREADKGGRYFGVASKVVPQKESEPKQKESRQTERD